MTAREPSAKRRKFADNDNSPMPAITNANKDVSTEMLDDTLADDTNLSLLCVAPVANCRNSALFVDIVEQACSAVDMQSEFASFLRSKLLQGKAGGSGNFLNDWERIDALCDSERFSEIHNEITVLCANISHTLRIATKTFKSVVDEKDLLAGQKGDECGGGGGGGGALHSEIAALDAPKASRLHSTFTKDKKGKPSDSPPPVDGVRRVLIALQRIGTWQGAHMHIDQEDSVGRLELITLFSYLYVIATESTEDLKIVIKPPFRDDFSAMAMKNAICRSSSSSSSSSSSPNVDDIVSSDVLDNLVSAHVENTAAKIDVEVSLSGFSTGCAAASAKKKKKCYTASSAVSRTSLEARLKTTQRFAWMTIELLSASLHLVYDMHRLLEMFKLLRFSAIFESYSDHTWDSAFHLVSVICNENSAKSQMTNRSNGALLPLCKEWKVLKKWDPEKLQKWACVARPSGYVECMLSENHVKDLVSPTGDLTYYNAVLPPSKFGHLLACSHAAAADEDCSSEAGAATAAQCPPSVILAYRNLQYLPPDLEKFTGSRINSIYSACDELLVGTVSLTRALFPGHFFSFYTDMYRENNLQSIPRTVFAKQTDYAQVVLGNGQGRNPHQATKNMVQQIVDIGSYLERAQLNSAEWQIAPHCIAVDNCGRLVYVPSACDRKHFFEFSVETKPFVTLLSATSKCKPVKIPLHVQCFFVVYMAFFYDYNFDYTVDSHTMFRLSRDSGLSVVRCARKVAEVKPRKVYMQFPFKNATVDSVAFDFFTKQIHVTLRLLNNVGGDQDLHFDASMVPKYTRYNMATSQALVDLLRCLATAEVQLEDLSHHPFFTVAETASPLMSTNKGLYKTYLGSHINVTGILPLPFHFSSEEDAHCNTISQDALKHLYVMTPRGRTPSGIETIERVGGMDLYMTPEQAAIRFHSARRYLYTASFGIYATRRPFTTQSPILTFDTVTPGPLQAHLERNKPQIRDEFRNRNDYWRTTIPNLRSEESYENHQATSRMVCTHFNNDLDLNVRDISPCHVCTGARICSQSLRSSSSSLVRALIRRRDEKRIEEELARSAATPPTLLDLGRSVASRFTDANVEESLSRAEAAFSAIFPDTMTPNPRTYCAMALDVLGSLVLDQVPQGESVQRAVWGAILCAIQDQPQSLGRLRTFVQSVSLSMFRQPNIPDEVRQALSSIDMISGPDGTETQQQQQQQEQGGGGVIEVEMTQAGDVLNHIAQLLVGTLHGGEDNSENDVGGDVVHFNVPTTATLSSPASTSRGSEESAKGATLEYMPLCVQHDVDHVSNGDYVPFAMVSILRNECLETLMEHSPLHFSFMQFYNGLEAGVGNGVTFNILHDFFRATFEKHTVFKEVSGNGSPLYCLNYQSHIEVCATCTKLHTLHVELELPREDEAEQRESAFRDIPCGLAGSADFFEAFGRILNYCVLQEIDMPYHLHPNLLESLLTRRYTFAHADGVVCRSEMNLFADSKAMAALQNSKSRDLESVDMEYNGGNRRRLLVSEEEECANDVRLTENTHMSYHPLVEVDSQPSCGDMSVWMSSCVTKFHTPLMGILLSHSCGTSIACFSRLLHGNPRVSAAMVRSVTSMHYSEGIKDAYLGKTRMCKEYFRVLDKGAFPEDDQSSKSACLYVPNGPPGEPPLLLSPKVAISVARQIAADVVKFAESAAGNASVVKLTHPHVREAAQAFTRSKAYTEIVEKYTSDGGGGGGGEEESDLFTLGRLLSLLAGDSMDMIHACAIQSGPMMKRVESYIVLCTYLYESLVAQTTKFYSRWMQGLSDEHVKTLLLATTGRPGMPTALGGTILESRSCYETHENLLRHASPSSVPSSSSSSSSSSSRILSRMDNSWYESRPGALIAAHQAATPRVFHYANALPNVTTYAYITAYFMSDSYCEEKGDLENIVSQSKIDAMKQSPTLSQAWEQVSTRPSLLPKIHRGAEVSRKSRSTFHQRPEVALVANWDFFANRYPVVASCSRIFKLYVYSDYAAFEKAMNATMLEKGQGFYLL